MYLKKLEILGFKSFANKTTVRFTGGVTAIVGPNGCGKTNILDALRWVLGEQRPTLLRGSKMEEVIFNGTRDVKPLGMSDVTLTVVNDRGLLPTEYHEVQVSRRLFRSGESEYLLNKVPCRLKDIQDLFTDTGMGAHSYSVIQQDMIDAVISDKAEERRFLFEEAAGITKYKQRKKAALRKLEATENDFLRLKDIYAEVKTQVNSLYRQHKKAERYQKVADEIKQWDLYLNSHRARTIELEKRELKAKIDDLANRKLATESTLAQLGAQLETDRNNLLDIERELNGLATQLHEYSESAHQIERQILLNREKRTNSETLIQKNAADIETLSVRIASLDEQLLKAGQEMGLHEKALDDLRTQVQEAEFSQAEADRDLLSARERKERENSRLLELEGQISSGRTEETNLKEQEQEMLNALGALEHQIHESQPRQQQLIHSHSELETRLTGLHARKLEMERQQASHSQKMEELVDRIEELGMETAQLQASIEATEAQRQLLQEMMLHYEGHESGLVAAMEQRHRWPGIAGTVADKFVPVEGLEIALESALGDMAGFLVCHDRTTAENIIAFLKSESKGKIGILVPESGILPAVVKRPEMEVEGFVGWLDAFVSCGEETRTLMEAVLSRTAVFRAGTDPQAILSRLPYGFGAVSTDGVYYSKNTITGGSVDRFPLFRRKEKVEEHERQVVTLTAQLNEARDKRNHATAEMAQLRADSGTLVSSLESLAEEISSTEKDVNELGYQRKTLAQEFERWEREKNQLSGRLEHVRSKQYSLGLGYSSLVDEKAALINSMGEAANRLQEFERKASETLQRVATLQVTFVEARNRVEQTASQISHLTAIRTEYQQTVEQKRAESETARQEAERSGDQTITLEQQLKDIFEKRELVERSVTATRTGQAEVLAQVQERERNTSTVRAERDQLNEEYHHLDIRLTSIDNEIRNITERMREEYDVDIFAVEAAKPTDTVPDEAIRDHVAELKDILRKMGAVNLLALEEYRTTSEREKFLSEQLADLTAAKNDLQQTITKINQTARQLFMETFEQARENFKTLFVELFSGGEADIMLDDPNDPLESDITIIARPRGKKLISITMMSGGERALTAISLLFSLYLVKPSPFCILDEIDAPLDDANCHRFLKIIRKFSRQTQFITITHNKITMEAADNLYGITMEQAGISKLVAVRFAGGSDDQSGGQIIVEGAVDAEEEPIEQVVAIVQSTPPLPEPTEEDAELPQAIQDRLSSEITIPEENA